MRVQTDGSSYKQVKYSAMAFMGLSHVLYLKEYLKGFIFMAVELLALATLPITLSKLIGLITLGSPQPDLPIMERDNSIFFLFDGIVTLILVLGFIGLYYYSVKDAVKGYEAYCIYPKFRSIQDTFKELTQKSFPIVGLMPAVILIVFFVLLPLVFSAAVAFTNYASPEHIPPNNTVDWVGFTNFKVLLTGQSLWSAALGRVALWTIVWAALATLTCYAGGMFIAVLLKESKFKIAPVFRSIFILPYAVPAVLSMLVWKNLLNGSFGVVNRTLIHLGLIQDAIPWLSDPWLAKFTVVLINLWAGFPYFMMLISGSMTAIPEDIYEAAEVDGASKLTTFRKITLPMVLFQTMPLLIMSFTHNINNFGAIFFLTGGLPVVSDTATTSAGGTDLLITWIYDLTIGLMKYNYGAALAVMIFIVLAPFAVFNFMRTKSFKEGEF